MAPTWVFLPGEFHGHRSLVGYRPWGRKEWDITERLSISTHTGHLKEGKHLSHPAIFEKAVSQEEVWILAFMGDNGMERFLRQDGCQDYIDYKAWISSPFPHTKWLRTSFHMQDPNLQASIQLPSWMTLPTYGIQMTFFLRHHSNFRRLHTPSQGWGSPALTLLGQWNTCAARPHEHFLIKLRYSLMCVRDMHRCQP